MNQFDFIIIGSQSAHQSADAIVFRYGDLSSPDKTTVVAVDAGRRSSAGGQIVSAVRNDFGLDRIDVAVSSHGDIDHSGGIPYVLANIAVGQVWMHLPHTHFGNKVIHASAQSIADVISAARRRGVDIWQPFSGAASPISELHVLGPSLEYYQDLLSRGLFSDDELDKIAEADSVMASAETQSKLLKNPTTSLSNNSSTILLLALEGFQLLLTADAGVEALRLAKPQAVEAGFDPNVAIVQIPHHGSRNSIDQETVDWMTADPAAAPAGCETLAFATAAIEDNHGFPHTEVTDAFILRGRKVPVPITGDIRVQRNIASPNSGRFTDPIEYIELRNSNEP